MKLKLKARTILWFLVISIGVYTILVLLFAWLYYETRSIGFYKAADQQVEEIDFLQSVYFSVVSFHTIGYGDIYPNSETGRTILMAESFLSLFYMSVFSGMLVYFIIRRHPDIFTTKHLYIRIRRDHWYMCIRLGTSGRPIIDLKGKFEAWLVEDNSRIRVYSFQEELADLEHILYFDVDLEAPGSEPLRKALVDSLNNGPRLHMKFNFIGNDIRSGEQVAHSAYYDSERIRFGRLFLSVYDWDAAGHRKNFQWKHFEQIEPLEESIEAAFRRGMLKS